MRTQAISPFPSVERKPVWIIFNFLIVFHFKKILRKIQISSLVIFLSPETAQDAQVYSCKIVGGMCITYLAWHRGKAAHMQRGGIR